MKTAPPFSFDQDKIYARRVFLAFFSFFITFILVDIVFVVLAVRTHTGVVTENAYEKGVSYNHILEMSQEQAARGWRGKVAVNGRVVSLDLTDHSGVAIGEKKVQVLFISPRGARNDFSIDLSEQKLGFYTGVLPLFVKGRWNLRFLIDTGQNQNLFQIYETVVFP